MKEAIKSKFEIFRQKTYIIIYGTNTFAGRLFDLILLGLILLSVILAMLETIQGFDVKYHKELVVCEKLYVKLLAIIFFKYIVFFLRFNIMYNF